MFSIHRLHILVELQRRGTLTDVAQALNYSPSTISQQLAQLEHEARTKLLEPAGRRVRLTHAGKILVRHGEAILVQLDRAEAELAATLSVISGEIRIATFQTATLALLPDLLNDIYRLHPQLRVFVSEIQPDASTSHLLARDFDLVLGEVYPGSPQPDSRALHIQHLSLDPMRLYTSQQMAAERTALADFADSTWVMEPVGKPARTWADAVCHAAGFEPQVRYESADLLVQLRLAETGHAAAFIPDLIWAARAPSGKLLALSGAPARQVYTAVRLGAEEMPALKEFRRIIGSVYQLVALGPSEMEVE